MLKRGSQMYLNSKFQINFYQICDPFLTILAKIQNDSFIGKNKPNATGLGLIMEINLKNYKQ